MPQKELVSTAVTRAQKLQLAGIMAAAAALYVLHSFLNFKNFVSKGYDLGIFDQAVRQYALFRPPIVPVKGVDYHLLGDHFHPILAVLAPLYWIWADPRMLGIALALLLVSTAVPVYLFTRGKLGHAPALVVSGALLLWWPFQSIVNWDFHEIAFAVPVVAWIIWAFDRARYGLVVGLSVPLLLVREDMGITIVAIAVVLAVHRRFTLAAVLAAAGLAGFVLVTKVAIPHFSLSGDFAYWQYTALGATASATVLFLLTHPLQSVAILFNHELKILLWLITFVPLALLPFASPYAIIGAPILLSRLFNDRLNTWGPVYQYDSILAPVFLLAAVDVLARIVARTGRKRLRLWGPVGFAAIAVIGTLFIHILFPLGKTLTAQNWTTPEHARAQQRAVDMIPSGVCVEATDTVVPHLVDRTYVSMHGDIGDELTNWMVIDTTVSEMGGPDPLSPEEGLERARNLGFTAVTEDDDGIWVLRRDIPVDPKCSSYLPSAAG